MKQGEAARGDTEQHNEGRKARRPSRPDRPRSLCGGGDSGDDGAPYRREAVALLEGSAGPPAHLRQRRRPRRAPAGRGVFAALAVLGAPAGGLAACVVRGPGSIICTSCECKV